MNIHFPTVSRTAGSEYRSVLSTPAGPAPGGDDWTGIECLRALYRRKSTIAWLTCLGAAAALLLTAAAPRWYQAQALVEVQGANENFLALRDVYPNDVAADSSVLFLQTQADLIQQDALLEDVVRTLHLQENPDFQSGPGFWGKLKRLVGAASPQPSPVRTAVEILRKKVSAVPSRNSRIIQITCDARTPALAADIANTLGERFIEQTIENRQRAARQTYETLRLHLSPRDRLAAPASASGDYTGTSPLDTSRPVYEALRQKAAEARVASLIRQSNIRLAGPAQPPLRPYKPNLPLNLAIGLFGGLIAGVALVMLQEQTRSVMRVPGDAGTCLTLPELGAIPMAPSPGFSALYLPNWHGGRLSVERASLDHRTSSLSEAFRTTLASILSTQSNGDHPRVLVVTSSRAMEGKTTVVSNLGIALAEISGKVLLIDGDMRRPQLHRVFDQANSWGLSDLLSEQNAIDELPLDVLVRKTGVPHLYLLSSGACTQNIFSLLCSGRMSRLLPRFREEFDYVLVDAPPCLEFADARIMARYAEQLLLVVRANHTDRKTAHAAVQRLQMDGIPVMGVILNRWNPAHSGMYRYPQVYDIKHQELA